MNLNIKDVSTNINIIAIKTIKRLLSILRKEEISGENKIIVVDTKSETFKVTDFNQIVNFLISCLLFEDDIYLMITKLKDAGITDSKPIIDISDANSPYFSGPNNLPATI